jgi:hypothetical protein
MIEQLTQHQANKHYSVCQWEEDVTTVELKVLLNRLIDHDHRLPFSVTIILTSTNTFVSY